jgi:hypothetical protein
MAWLKLRALSQLPRLASIGPILLSHSDAAPVQRQPLAGQEHGRTITEQTFEAAAVEPPAARVKRRDCGASREVDGVHNTLAEYAKRSTLGANPFALIPTCTFTISQQGNEDYRHENVHVRCGPGVVRRVVR